MLRLGPRASFYLRRHPEFSGWWDIRDDWPRGPYVAVFVAGDPAKYRRRILELAAFPKETRVVRVRYSDRYRARVQERIDHDEAALRRAGFDDVETEFDIGTDRIDVDLVTRRTD